MMKALFGRKVSDLEKLKEITKAARRKGQQGQSYTVIREIVLGNADFSAFSKDFLKDQPWVAREDGGMNKAGEIRCLRVVNKDTGEKVLVNTEGYDYPRYTGLEFE